MNSETRVIVHIDETYDSNAGSHGHKLHSLKASSNIDYQHLMTLRVDVTKEPSVESNESE